MFRFLRYSGSRIWGIDTAPQ